MKAEIKQILIIAGVCGIGLVGLKLYKNSETLPVGEIGTLQNRVNEAIELRDWKMACETQMVVSDKMIEQNIPLDTIEKSFDLENNLCQRV